MLQLIKINILDDDKYSILSMFVWEKMNIFVHLHTFRKRGKKTISVCCPCISVNSRSSMNTFEATMFLARLKRTTTFVFFFVFVFFCFLDAGLSFICLGDDHRLTGWGWKLHGAILLVNYSFWTNTGYILYYTDLGLNIRLLLPSLPSLSFYLSPNTISFVVWKIGQHFFIKMN